MRDAAEVKRCGERIKIIILSCVENVLDALIGPAVIVAAGGEHHLPIIFRRRHSQRSSADARDFVVAGNRGGGNFPRSIGIFIHVSSSVKLAMTFRRIDSLMD